MDVVIEREREERERGRVSQEGEDKEEEDAKWCSQRKNRTDIRTERVNIESREEVLHPHPPLLLQIQEKRGEEPLAGLESIIYRFDYWNRSM